jgi:hypothetical protein
MTVCYDGPRGDHFGVAGGIGDTSVIPARTMTPVARSVRDTVAGPSSLGPKDSRQGCALPWADTDLGGGLKWGQFVTVWTHEASVVVCTYWMSEGRDNERNARICPVDMRRCRPLGCECRRAFIVVLGWEKPEMKGLRATACKLRSLERFVGGEERKNQLFELNQFLALSHFQRSRAVNSYVTTIIGLTALQRRVI